MIKILKAVLTTILILCLITGVFVFAGLYTKMFMGVCFFGMFCCVASVVWAFQNYGGK